MPEALNTTKSFTRTVLVPLYRSAEHVSEVFSYVSRISDVVGTVEILFVNDGSPDDSESRVLLTAPQFPFRVKMVRLSRNFGVGPAIHAGLQNVSTDSVVIIGSDLQEPASLYIRFFQLLEADQVDVCLGERLTRDDPITMKFFSAIFWMVHRRLVDPSTPKGGFDGVGLSQKAAKAIAALPELNTSITSQLQWIGFNRVFIPFHRSRRISGNSSWTFRRRVRLFADSIYGFTAAPITFLTLFGILGSTVMMLALLVTGIGALLGWMIVPGYATIVILGALGHSISILGLGIVGGYVYRAFENSKGRPKYLIDQVYEVRDSHD